MILYDVSGFKLRMGTKEKKGFHQLKNYPRLTKALAIRKGSKMLEDGWTVKLIRLDESDYP